MAILSVPVATVKNTFIEFVEKEDSPTRRALTCTARFACSQGYDFFPSDDASVTSDADNMRPEHNLAPLPRDDLTKTTVLAKNLPTGCTRNMVTSRLDACGFRGTYDFIYLPVGFENLESFGYCFINFVTHEEALRFGDSYIGSRFFEECVGVAEWCGAMQGLETHVERYRNSPLMHKSMPAEVKPLLFKNGQPVAFPPPTKVLKIPKKMKASKKL